MFAAASLTDALTEIGRDWKARSGHPVVFSFGASGDLARQIAAGAPADVFFSADVDRVRALERAGLVRPGDCVEALSNVLAVVVPSAAPASVRTPEDLLKLRRLALADPEIVPAGAYARQWLESLGLWAKLRDRLVPTLDVRAAVAAVAAQGADAGIVYRTDVTPTSGVRIAFEVGNGPRILYGLAPLAASRAGARDFVRFLLGPLAREVYRRRGFLVVVPE